MNPVFLKLHLQQIHKFDVLWIPDEENETNLSGKLSHDINFNIPYTYIGIQSRFSNYVKNPSSIEGLSFDVLIVLSGVEPQRSFLENKFSQKETDKTMIKKAFEGRVANQASTFDISEKSRPIGVGYNPSLIIWAMTIIRYAVVKPAIIERICLKDYCFCLFHF